MSKEFYSQTHMGGGRRDYSYDIIRVTLVILVVLGHSDFYQIKTAFGGIYLMNEMELHQVQDTQLHGIIRMLSAIIYSFHMPAFVALSGALYMKHYGKYKTFRGLIEEKARNLLLPYLIVWILWNIPIKYIAGYYKGIPVWKWLAQIVVPYDVYLWFLLSLFIVFALSYGLNKLKKATIALRFIIVLAGFGVSLVCQRLMGMYMPLGNPMKYLLWFEMGRLLEERKEAYIGIENSSYQMFVASGLGVAFSVAFYISQHVSHLGWVIRDTICPFAGLLVLWIIANNAATELRETTKKKLLNVSSYSMGLFLYAEPINYLVLFAMDKVCGIEFFGTNAGTVTIFSLRLFFSVLVSVLITRGLMRSRVRVKLY